MASSNKSLDYKNIPKSWEVKQVKELSTLEKNAVLTGPFGSLLHSSDYVESGIPLLLVKNIKNGNIDVKNIPFVTEKDAQRLSRYRVKEGDIVFSRVGRVGSSALIEKEHEGWLISGQTLRIRFDNPKINPKYINYFFQSDVFSDILSKEILGMTRDSINTSILAKISVLIPTLSEQEKIVSNISNLEYLIEKYDSILKLNKFLNQGLMEKLLTKGIGHKKFKKVKLIPKYQVIKIPEEWELISLDNLLISQNSGLHDKLEKVSDGKNIAGMVDLYKNMKIDGQKFLQAKFPKDIDESKFVLETNDLVYVEISLVRTGVGKTVCVTKKGEGTFFAGNLRRFKVNNSINAVFLNYLLNTKLYRNSIINRSYTSALTGIRSKDYYATIIPLPSLSEQKEIVKIMDNYGAKISTLESTKTYFQNLKKGLMQKILTGQIRVTI